MPCSCEGYPKPTLSEILDSREKEAERRYKKLYDCHQRVVTERDQLLKEVKELKETCVEFSKTLRALRSTKNV